MPAVARAAVVRGCAGKTIGSSSSARAAAMRRERLGLDVGLAVEREDEVGARLDARPFERFRTLAGERGQAEVGVVHHVPDLVDALGDALGREVRDGHVGRAEEQAGEAVDEHAVQLLRHGAVEGAQAGLDVGDGHEELSPLRERPRAWSSCPRRRAPRRAAPRRRPPRSRAASCRSAPRASPSPSRAGTGAARARARRRTPPRAPGRSAAPCGGRPRLDRARAGQVRAVRIS